MRTLTIQTIRFTNPVDELARSLASHLHAVARAREAGVTGEVAYVHGDASLTPLDTAEVATLRDAATAAGVEYGYVFFDENTGTARGQNRLAAQWPARWHYVSNPDVIVGGTSLARMWPRTEDAAVGLIEARQLPIEKPRDYDADTGRTSWADGSCTLVRGDLWRQLEGYDETFFLYGDDVDMSWRARLAGFGVIHEPTARIFHDKRGDATVRTPPCPHEVHYSALASYLMARKWGTGRDVARVRENIVGPEYDEVRRVIADLDERAAYPARVAGAERVAEFSDSGAYGVTRW